MSNREARVYKIIAIPENLDILEKFLRHAEYLGNIGASRNLLLRVDGDGSGQIQIQKLVDIENASIGVTWEKIDHDKYNTKQNLGNGALSGIYDIE